MNEFFELFFSGKYLTVLIVVILILILIVIMYLMKCQKEEKNNEGSSSIINDSLHKKDVIDNASSLSLANEFIFEDSTREVKELNKVASNTSEHPGTLETNDDDENTAIISTDELLKAASNYEKVYGETVEDTISKYEEEQEKKAIISYEELLKNAALLKDTFKEPEKKISKSYNIGDITVNQITGDIKKVNNYIEEELFLKTLKDFRLNLK